MLLQDSFHENLSISQKQKYFCFLRINTKDTYYVKLCHLWIRCTNNWICSMCLAFPSFYVFQKVTSYLSNRVSLESCNLKSCKSWTACTAIIFTCTIFYGTQETLFSQNFGLKITLHLLQQRFEVHELMLNPAKIINKINNNKIMKVDVQNPFFNMGGVFQPKWLGLVGFIYTNFNVIFTIQSKNAAILASCYDETGVFCNVKILSSLFTIKSFDQREIMKVHKLQDLVLFIFSYQKYCNAFI